MHHFETWTAADWTNERVLSVLPKSLQVKYYKGSTQERGQGGQTSKRLVGRYMVQDTLEAVGGMKIGRGTADGDVDRRFQKREWRKIT